MKLKTPKHTAGVQKRIQKASQSLDNAIKRHKKVFGGSPIYVCPASLISKKQKAYGAGSELAVFQGLLQALKIAPSNRTRANRKAIKNASETIGEVAAEAQLRQMLATRNIPWNPACLQKFSASGVFNLVYMDPPLTTASTIANYTPKFVYVLEAKGGNSQCQSRHSKIYKSDVEQGTYEYCETIAALMADSTYKSKSTKPADLAERRRRKLIGNAVQKAMQNNTGVYAGVRGGYDTDSLHKPETIFTVDF